MMERIPLNKNPTGKALLLVALSMLTVGVVMVNSAVASVVDPGPWYARVDSRHNLFAGIAALVLLLAWRGNYRWLDRGKRAPVIPGVLLVVALLASVLVFVPGIGRSVGGYYRWIRIGPGRYAIGFQPSELLKLAVIVFLASWLARKSLEELRSLPRTTLPAAGVILLAAGVVMTQDFGTGMIIALGGLVTLMLAGVPWRHLGLLCAGAGSAFCGLILISPRRWNRIAALLDPFSSSNPSAYQPRQSLMAILSGGWFGKGTGCGIRKLGFLPEDSTDFIFSIICEEWGFVGAVLLLALIALWIYTASKAATRCDERLGRILAGSLGFLVGAQAILHVAVGLVLAPPTGVGLPFVSAGGTGLVTMAAAAALIVSVTSRTARRAPPGTL